VRGLAQQTWAYLRVVALALLILIGLFVAGAGVSSWYTCHAAHSCPANGCGDVPAENCQHAITFALEAAEAGIPLIFVALGVVIWSLRVDGRRLANPAG
jgi:hypothetical protein